jgi:thioredoxin-related protein
MAPLFKPLIFTFMTLFSLWGGTIQDDKQFQDAVISMGKEDKLVLMIYTTDSCPECAYMKQKVFHDKIVEPYMSRNFVLIEKNVQKNVLPDGYDFFGIPTMFFIDRLGNKKGTIIGSKRSQAFLDEITRIKEQK